MSRPFGPLAQAVAAHLREHKVATCYQLCAATGVSMALMHKTLGNMSRRGEVVSTGRLGNALASMYALSDHLHDLIKAKTEALERVANRKRKFEETRARASARVRAPVQIDSVPMVVAAMRSRSALEQAWRP